MHSHFHTLKRTRGIERGTRAPTGVTTSTAAAADSAAAGAGAAPIVVVAVVVAVVVGCGGATVGDCARVEEGGIVDGAV